MLNSGFYIYLFFIFLASSVAQEPCCAPSVSNRNIVEYLKSICQQWSATVKSYLSYGGVSTDLSIVDTVENRAFFTMNQPDWKLGFWILGEQVNLNGKTVD